MDWQTITQSRVLSWKSLPVTAWGAGGGEKLLTWLKGIELLKQKRGKCLAFCGEIHPEVRTVRI